MSYLTLGEVKDKVARAVGKCSTDTYVTDLINEAQQRLLNRAQHVVGGFARYRFCTNEGCIVLPRQIKTVERFAVCETPGEVYPLWHEFLGNGTYLYDNDDSPGRMMIDHGRTATFADIESGKSVTQITVTNGGSGYTTAPTVTITNDSTDTTGAGATATANVAAGAVVSVTITASGSGFTATPTIGFSGPGTGAAATATIGFNRKVRALSSLAATDTGKTVIIQGYDENGQWVRTLDGASYIDGEKLTLAGAEVNSATTFTAVTRVIKEVTSGRVDMWSWDSTASLSSRQIAAYEPGETLPTYRKMFVPGLQNYDSCGSNSSCDNKSVTVLARLQHVPVAVDNDFLVVDNAAAIKLMAMAIQREEQNMLQEAAVYEAKANREIEGEFQAHTGEGPVVNIRHAGKLVSGANVFNPI